MLIICIAISDLPVSLINLTYMFIEPLFSPLRLFWKAEGHRVIKKVATLREKGGGTIKAYENVHGQEVQGKHTYAMKNC